MSKVDYSQLEGIIASLLRRIERLETRSGQSIQFGLDAELPATPVVEMNSTIMYLATDTEKLYVWNPTGAVWLSVELE